MNKEAKHPRDISENGLDDFLKKELGIPDAITVLVITEKYNEGHTFARGTDTYNSDDLEQATHRIKHQSAIEIVEVDESVAGSRLCRICTPWGYFWVTCACR